MSLVDTTDGVLMLGAYGWAFVKPMRKLYYNLTITFVSVLVAVLVGGIEALGLVAGKLNLDGGFWRAVGALDRPFRRRRAAHHRRLRGELAGLGAGLSLEAL